MKKMIVALTGALALASTGCGKLSNIVTDVRYQAYSDGQGNPMTKVEFDLNTGSLLLPAMSVPIVNPHDPSQVYGTITMSDILGGGTALIVDANIEAITHTNLPADGCLLPNGHNIPVVLPAGMPCPIGIPLGSGGSRLYLAFSDTVALVGTAIVIREFDAVGSAIIGADIFPGFTLSNGIRGVAGLFTSRNPGQSGVGVFADINAVIPHLGVKKLALDVGGKVSVQSTVGFAADQSSNGTLKKAQKALNKLAGKRLNAVN